MQAVVRQDLKSVLINLAYSKPEDVNIANEDDKRTCLHIAAINTNLVILQLLIWVINFLKLFFVFSFCLK